VDVYYEWVDACDAVQNGNDGGSVKATRQPAPLRRGSTGAGADDDDLDGFVENDEPDMEREYGEA
jgi:hypothetical protein